MSKMKSSRVFYIIAAFLVFGIVQCVIFLALGPTIIGFSLIVIISVIIGIGVASVDTKNSVDSMTDKLTGLWNRRGFDRYLNEEYNRQLRLDEPQPLSVLIMDLDDFKAYNDTYGHLSGDRVLRAVANVMQAHANRPADKVFRQGGEEFCVMLPDTDLRGCMHIAEAIREDVEGLEIEHKNSSCVPIVTISIGGVTVRADDINQLEDVINEADDNLYKSKHNGRNKVTAGSM